MDLLQQTATHLMKRKFETQIFETGQQAAQGICARIKGCSVGLGSSMTIQHIGLFNMLKANAESVFEHQPGQAGDDERKAMVADYFITSANGLSKDGQIVNIDGTGNRIAATCFGPGEVIYVIGKNKIAPTLDDALYRAKETAVKLAKHFNRKTPCIKTGKCEDCLSPECLCSITTIHRKKPYGTRISVFLINEEVGL
jgi:L-lactate utilization protein LutC